MQQRLHPAASRIAKLSKDTPASFTVFDTLFDVKGKPIGGSAFADRRAALDKIAAKFVDKSITLTSQTASLPTAQSWLDTGFAGDRRRHRKAARRGIPVRRAGDAEGKTIRTADCVVGGFRYAQGTRVVGSLLLGLYNDKGLLDHVGFTSAFAKVDKAALTAKLEKLVGAPGFTGDAPGGPSRWATERSAEWQPLKTKLVVEVSFDHVTGGRFRHGTRLLRWRPDEAPAQCTFDQIG